MKAPRLLLLLASAALVAACHGREAASPTAPSEFPQTSGMWGSGSSTEPKDTTTNTQ